MSTDDIEKKLKEINRQREHVEERIKESEDTLLSIDETMADFKKRQTDRLNTDNRLTDEVVQRVSAERGIED